MALVYTATLSTRSQNQPFSLGSIKGRIVNIDVTSYLNPGGATITPESVGLNFIHAIVPLEAFTQGGAAQHRITTNQNVITYWTLASPAVEAADTVDVGDIDVLVLGA